MHNNFPSPVTGIKKLFAHFQMKRPHLAKINLLDKVEEVVILQRATILLGQIQSFPHQMTFPVLYFFPFHDPPSWSSIGRGTGPERKFHISRSQSPCSGVVNMAAENKPTVLVTGEKSFILRSFRQSLLL